MKLSFKFFLAVGLLAAIATSQDAPAGQEGGPDAQEGGGPDAQEGADAAVEEGAPVEEVMCAFFEGSPDVPTCETCLENGCGWTADDGDCLQDCATVNDGAACISLLDGQDITDLCGGGEPGTEEVGEPVTDATGEPVAEEGGEPVAEATGEPVAEEGGEPVAEATGEPVAEEGGEEPVAEEGGEEPVAEEGGEPEGEEGGEEPEGDEAMCSAFKKSGETPTCQTCLVEGCGWTAENGDCLKSCDEVTNGATCLSGFDGEDISDICAGAESGGDEGEEGSSFGNGGSSSNGGSNNGNPINTLASAAVERTTILSLLGAAAALLFI